MRRPRLIKIFEGSPLEAKQFEDEWPSPEIKLITIVVKTINGVIVSFYI